MARLASAGPAGRWGEKRTRGSDHERGTFWAWGVEVRGLEGLTGAYLEDKAIL